VSALHPKADTADRVSARLVSDLNRAQMVKVTRWHAPETIPASTRSGHSRERKIVV